MPIQIIDNFELNSPKPLDNRLVVGSQSFYTNKDDIPYKYAGMRIWDLDAGIPYYWTGSTYSSENTSTISGPGTFGYIPKYILTNVVGNSLLYDDGISSVGVGTNNPFNAVPGLNGLDVIGRIRSSTGFMGSGQFLQSINASNITLGSLSLARLTNGSSGQVLVAGVSQPQWTNANQITVGTSSAVSITNDTASATTHYLTFATTTSNSSIVKVSSSKLQFVPSTGNFYVSGNVGLGTSPSTEKLKVLGVVSITGNTTIIGVARITRSGSGAFDLGYQTGSTNFDIEANSTSTQLKIYNPTSPGTYYTTITQFSNYTFIGGNGQTYLNVNNEGNRLLAFGRVGLNDQMVVYMDNSPLSVPTVGGKGVLIQYNLRVNGTLSKSSGTFQIEHPLESKKKTHTLVHSFIEGPQADLIYRGKVNLVAGKAEINIDEVSTMTEGTFVALNRNVQCFTSNESGWSAVRGSVSGNVLTIESSDNNSNDLVSWMVIGERQDKHMLETNWTDENGKVIVEPEIIK